MSGFLANFVKVYSVGVNAYFSCPEVHRMLLRSVGYFYGIFGRLYGTEHLAELCFQSTPRVERCQEHTVYFSMFQGSEHIDALASKSSTSFSISTIEKADL